MRWNGRGPLPSAGTTRVIPGCLQKGKAGLNVSNVETHLNRGFFYIIAITALGALTACSSSNKLAQCPSVSAVIDTATMPVFKGSPSKLAYTVYIIKATRD